MYALRAPVCRSVATLRAAPAPQTGPGWRTGGTRAGGRGGTSGGLGSPGGYSVSVPATRARRGLSRLRSLGYHPLGPCTCASCSPCPSSPSRLRASEGPVRDGSSRASASRRRRGAARRRPQRPPPRRRSRQRCARVECPTACVTTRARVRRRRRAHRIALVVVMGMSTQPRWNLATTGRTTSRGRWAKVPAICSAMAARPIVATAS